MSGEHRRLQSRGFVIHSPTEFQVTRPERYRVGEYINVRPVGEVRLIVQIDGDRITIAPALGEETVRRAWEIRTVHTYRAPPRAPTFTFANMAADMEPMPGLSELPGAQVMRQMAEAYGIIPKKEKPPKPTPKAEPLPEPGERFIDLSEEE